MVERTLPKPDTRVRFPSAALYPLTSSVRGFCFGLLWVWLVEAVCSLLLQGTRPRSASDTLMSRRNIPTSPLSLPSPEGGVVGAAHQRLRTAGRMAWEECARKRGGEYWGKVPQTARRTTRVDSRVPRWFRRGAWAPPEGGSPAGAKEVYNEPAAHTPKRLKNVQLTTQLC